MTTPNDVIWLRFYRDDREAPPVDVDAFYNLIRAMQAVAMSVAQHYGMEIRGVNFSIAARPRAACLEIPVVLGVLNDPGVAVILETLGHMGVDAFRAFEEHVDTVSLIATLVFGGNCVVDLWTKRGQKKDIVAPPEKQVLVSMSSEALKSEQIIQGAIQIVQAAAACKMDRVELEVRDDAVVVLYSSDGRTRPGLIGSRPQNPLDDAYKGTPDAQGRSRLHYRLNELQPFKVAWEGVQYPAYVVYANQPNRAILLVWAAKTAQPVAWEAGEVRGEFIDPAALVPVDPAPDEAEMIDGAFVVRGVVRVEE